MKFQPLRRIIPAYLLEASLTFSFLPFKITFVWICTALSPSCNALTAPSISASSSLKSEKNLPIPDLIFFSSASLLAKILALAIAWFGNIQIPTWIKYSVSIYSPFLASFPINKSIKPKLHLAGLSSASSAMKHSSSLRCTMSFSSYKEKSPGNICSDNLAY